MSGVVLFCTAQEAEPLARTCLEPIAGMQGLKAVRWFCLAEPRSGPTAGDELRETIGLDEDWPSNFNGASEHDCQQWLQQRETFDRSIFPGFLAIADKRSARDGTILIQRFVDSLEPYSIEDEDSYGVRAPPPNMWYSFRVEYLKAPNLIITLEEGLPDLVYLALFAGISELTTAEGLVDMERLDKIMSGKEPIDADAEGNVVFG